MKNLFFIALFALAFTFQGNLFGQSIAVYPTNLSGQEVEKVLSETSTKTGITDAELHESYQKGELDIQETPDGFRVFLSTDHGGGVVDISEENF